MPEAKVISRVRSNNIIFVGSSHPTIDVFVDKVGHGKSCRERSFELTPVNWTYPGIAECAAYIAHGRSTNAATACGKDLIRPLKVTARYL